jgi:hypothetical protein
MGGFTIPRGYRLPSNLNIPGVSVVDSYGGQRVEVSPGTTTADLAPINLAVSQAVNANNPALAQRNYRDFIDRSALDYAEIERRKADSNLNTAIGLLAAAAMPYAAPALGSLLGAGSGLLGSAVGGGLIGGATAAATGDSIVEGVLTGGLSGGLAGVDVGQILPGASRATQAVTDSGISALSAISAAGPAVMDAQKQQQETVPVQVVDFPEYGATSTEPVIIDVPVEEAGGGATPAPAPAPTPTPAPAPAPTPTPTGGGMEDTTGADPILSNQILEAILAETNPNVRDGLIQSWEDYTGETWNDTLVPNYPDREPVEPIGYVWGDGVWAPVFDEVPSGDVIFEPGANKPDYNPDEQQEEAVDVFAPPDFVLDTTAPEPITPPPAPAPEPAPEPVPQPVEAPVTPVEPTPVPTPAPPVEQPVEPVTEPVQQPTEEPAPQPDTGTDESVAVGGEGTGTGEGSGEGEGDGEGDGNGLGAGLMAAAAGAAFEPQWNKLFKYTTLTPYQKKTLAPYVDYIAQARGMTGRGMLS